MPSDRMNASLNVLESERIIAVLEDTIEKIKHLDLLKTDVFQYRQDAASKFGGDLSKVVNMHEKQVQAQEDLVHEKQESKAKSNSRRFKEIQNELIELNRSIHDSDREITKTLKNNSVISSNLSKLKTDRSQIADLLLRCAQELRDTRTYVTITSKVDEELKKQAKLQSLKDTEKLLNSEVNTLNDHLKQIDDDLDRIMTEKTREISELKDSIDFIHTDIYTNSTFQRKQCQGHVADKWREYKLIEQELDGQISRVQEKQRNESIVSTEAIAFLECKSKSLKDEIETTKADHTIQHNNIVNQLNRQHEEYQDLHDKLELLRARKAEENHRVREEAEAKARDAEFEFQRRCEDLRQNNAAKHLQRAMKVYLDHLNRSKPTKPTKPTSASKAKKGTKKVR